MFDIGFWELIIIGVVGLLVLGPERLPSAIRSFQRTLSQVKQFGSRMQAELHHELRVKDLPANNLSRQMQRCKAPIKMVNGKIIKSEMNNVDNFAS